MTRRVQSRMPVEGSSQCLERLTPFMVNYRIKYWDIIGLLCARAHLLCAQQVEKELSLFEKVLRFQHKKKTNFIIDINHTFYEGKMVLVIHRSEEMRAFSRRRRCDGKKIGYVPTMGALHEGHLSLLQQAKNECDETIVSIYVNPTQFSKNEDFGVYPRNLETDIAKLESVGCTVLFAPYNLYYTPPDKVMDDGSLVVGANDDEIDPRLHSTWIAVDHVSQGLCARSRPHFFKGVCTIVAKLFNIVEPDAAYFGKKDYQQWKVITRMARDLDYSIQIVGVPICREPDGLAMSSRNALLTPEDRRSASCIYRSLQEAQDTVQRQETVTSERLKAKISSEIERHGGIIDYVEIVHAENLQPLADSQIGRVPTLVAVAAFFGKVRLIDNIDFD